MPHKHKRKRDDDVSNFDLAPSARAKPLAAYTKASLFSSDQDGSSSNNKRRRSSTSKSRTPQDDTPKAFARMMAWQATGKKPNGLDDGNSTKPSKKRTTAAGGKFQKSEKSNVDPVPEKSTTTTTTNTTVTGKNTTAQPLKIHPTESLATFSQRVDQTLPLTSLTRTTTPTNLQNLPADVRQSLQKSQRTTKHNQRLQRLQSDWRATDTRLRAKQQEEHEDQEDRREEENLLWSSVKHATSNQKGKKLKNKKKSNNGDEDDDIDPWKQLDKKRREETRQKNLQDVVKAPPTLTRVKKKFKSREGDFDFWDDNGKAGDGEVLVDVDNVPGAKGRSLRRREELNETRRRVIEGYRKMQGKKRGVVNERLTLSRAVMT